MQRHICRQHLCLKRLGEVVHRAVTHGLDRHFNRAESRHQHHRQLRPFPLDLFQQGMAVHAWHLDVCNHHLHRLAVENVQRRIAIVSGFRGIARQGQRVAQGVTQLRIIFHDQNHCLFHNTSQGLLTLIAPPRRRPFFCGARRIERHVLNVHKRNATPPRGKMAPSLRVAPQNGPCGVARRSFGTTKLLSSRLAWPVLERQRGSAISVNRPLAEICCHGWIIGRHPAVAIAR